MPGIRGPPVGIDARGVDDDHGASFSRVARMTGVGNSSGGEFQNGETGAVEIKVALRPK